MDDIDISMCCNDVWKAVATEISSSHKRMHHASTGAVVGEVPNGHAQRSGQIDDTRWRVFTIAVNEVELERITDIRYDQIVCTIAVDIPDTVDG